MRAKGEVPGKNVGLTTFEDRDGAMFIADGTVRFPAVRRTQLRMPLASVAFGFWSAAELTLW